MDNNRPRNWWTEDEHKKFLELVPKLQRNWKDYTVHLPNRNVQQIRSHAQKYFLGIQRDPEYKMYSGMKKRKTSSTTSSAYVPIMNKILPKQLKIDLKSASNVKKQEIKSRSSSTFSFDSDISELTCDSFSSIDEILRYFDEMDNINDYI